MVETGLRMPELLHAAMVAWAKEEGRSLNAQIVYLLKMAVNEAGKPTGKEEGK